jgi:Flp pilus assembly protein TadB
MKYMVVFEYMYLIAAAVLAAFLASKFKELETAGIVLLCVAIGICAFMYSFRRKQRKAAEQRERDQSKGEKP